MLQARLPKPDSSADPLVAYTLGWLHERQGDAAAAAAPLRGAAASCPSDYCFPFRLESEPVLARAIAADPKDARAPYYLGNLLYDLQPERAIRSWEQSRTLDPRFARVHRNLAFAYARVRGDLAKAVASQQQAVALEKNEPRLYYELDQYLAWSQRAAGRAPREPDREPGDGRRSARSRARASPACSCCSAGTRTRWRRSAAGRFHVWEGERGISRRLRPGAHRGRAARSCWPATPAAALEEFKAALAIPANIEVGQAVGAQLAAAHHHVGLALEALGRKDEAPRAFRQSAGAPTPLVECHYWVGRSLEKLGAKPEAQRHFQRLAAAKPRPVDARAAARGADGGAGEASPTRTTSERWACSASAARPRRGRRWPRRAEADPDHVGAAMLKRALAAPLPAARAAAGAARPKPRSRRPAAGRGADARERRGERTARRPLAATQPRSSSLRMASIDAFRGLVMLLMMGEALEFCHVASEKPLSALWAFLCHHQSHVPWVGCSLHDLIQPGFSFLVGAALPYSLSARATQGQGRGAMIAHAFRRALILVLLGVFLRSLGQAQTYWTFEDTLTQIGLGYGFLFLLGLRPRREQWIAFAVILVAFWLAFALYPVPGPGFDWQSVGVPADWNQQLSGFEAHWNKGANLSEDFDRWFLNLFPREQPFVYNARQLVDAELRPDPGDDDPRPARRRRPAQHRAPRRRSSAGSSPPASRRSRRAACCTCSAWARSSSASGPRATRCGAAAGASCSWPSSTGCST